MFNLITKYIAVGLFNTLITGCVIFILMHIGMGVYGSNFIGYVIGIIVSFVLNSTFTFSCGMNVRKFFMFLLTCGICYLLNLFAIKVFLIFFPTQLYVSQLVGMFFYTFAGFVINKYWVMK